jgi:hypothetical protein
MRIYQDRAPDGATYGRLRQRRVITYIVRFVSRSGVAALVRQGPPDARSGLFLGACPVDDDWW